MGNLRPFSSGIPGRLKNKSLQHEKAQQARWRVSDLDALGGSPVDRGCWQRGPEE